MKNNQRIKKLLQDFDYVNPEFGKIIRSLRKTVMSIAPDSEEKIMYGGIIFVIPIVCFAAYSYGKTIYQLNLILAIF